MTDDDIVDCALRELSDKTLGVTKQYLEIHDVARAGGRPNPERIDKERDDGLAIVYFPIQGERFHLAVYVDTSAAPRVTGLGTEAHHRVYLRATSEELDLTQLLALTKLTPTSCWNKGDPRRPSPDLRYNFSMIEFLPNPEPDEFEDKMRKLLDYLEGDSDGVRTLVDRASAYVQVASYYHNGNGMIGGPHLNREAIGRLSELNLAIDFDTYVEGNPFT